MNRSVHIIPTIFAVLIACFVVFPALTTFAAAAPSAGTAAKGPGELPAGVSLLRAATLAAFVPPAATPSLKIQVVPVDGQPFARAIRARTLRQPAQEWNLQLSARTAAPVRKGDVILASFFLLGSGSMTGEARTELIFEGAAEPFTKSVSYLASAGSTWQHFQVPFVAAGDYPAGGAQLNFRLGFAPQTATIGGVTLVDYGTAVRLQDLPSTGLTYPGMEPGAAWRKAAEDRIERIRKADLTVVVRDGNGRPIPAALVHISMRRHAFGFGSAVDADALLGTTPDDLRYQAMVRKLFNKAVLENDLKWPGWEARPERALAGVRWLRANGIEVRGHNLVWPSWQWMPADIRALRNDPEALRQRILAHVTQEAAALKGQVVEWDVLNEPYTSHVFMDLFGKESMVEWFRLAHAADPGAELFVNDYSILSAGGRDTAHQNAYEATIRYLLDSGAPLEGIGLQSHFSSQLTSPERLLQILDHFSQFDLPLESTEFDINITDETMQARYLQDFMTALFSHPMVKGIVMWGFWEGRDWEPRAALFRKDWSVKPAGQAWMDLVLHRWWTEVDGRTGADGAYRTRGFLGDYDVTVTVHGRSRTVMARLPHEGARIQVTLP